MSNTALNGDITAFKNYLEAERGMAKNTVLAYHADLRRFGGSAQLDLADYLAPKIRELTHYIEFLREEKLAPPSAARHLVALKMFYRFLRLEERVAQNTVELLCSPKLWERIPQVLSPDSVDRLLSAPRADERFFLRDRALLDAPYATGSRGSEVVGLRLADMHLDSGFCKCTGKGSKQRVVPIGEHAAMALRAYLHNLRPRLVKSDDVPCLFVGG